MSDWSSFDKDKEIADAWRDFLNESDVTDHEIELDEGLMDTLGGFASSAKGSLAAKFPDLSVKGALKGIAKGLAKAPGFIYQAITATLPEMTAEMRDTVQLYSAWGKPAASSIGRLTQRAIEAAAERMEIVSLGAMESAAAAEREALEHEDVLPSSSPLLAGLDDAAALFGSIFSGGEEEPEMAAEAKEAKLTLDDPAMMRRINEATKQMSKKMVANLEKMNITDPTELKKQEQVIAKHIAQLRAAAIHRGRYLLSKKLAVKHKQNVSAATKRMRKRDKLLSQLMAATTLEEYGEPYKQLAELLGTKSRWAAIVDKLNLGHGLDEVMGLLSDLPIEDPENYREKFREIAVESGAAETEPEKDSGIKFEDLVQLTNLAVQVVLKQVDRDDLVLALKGATQELQDLFLANVSSRAANDIREDMEIMGPVPSSRIRSAQSRILKAALKLVEDGSIYMPMGQEEEEEEVSEPETPEPEEEVPEEATEEPETEPEKVKMAEKPTNFQGDNVNYENIQRAFKETFPKGNFSEAMQAWADLMGPIFPDRYESDLAGVKEDYEQRKDTVQKALLGDGRGALRAKKLFYALAKAYTYTLQNIEINGKRWSELSPAERIKNITSFVAPQVMAIMIRNIVAAEDEEPKELNEQKILNHWKLLAGIK